MCLDKTLIPEDVDKTIVDRIVEKLNLSLLDTIYNDLFQQVEDNKELSGDHLQYLYGAQDALMAILGEQNKLTRLLGYANNSFIVNDLSDLDDIPEEEKQEYYTKLLESYTVST